MGSVDRIRVALLIGHLGYGGTERQLFLLLTNLDLRKFEPLVVVFNESPNDTYVPHLENLGVRVVTIPPKCRGVLSRALFLWRLLREFRPAIVHSWTTHDNPYAGVVGRMAGVPVRWGSVRLSLSARSFSDLSRLSRWLSLFSVQHHVVNAGSLITQLETAGVPAERITFIRNCVATHLGEIRGTPLLTEYGIGPDNPVVGVVANFRRTKNLTVFVRVLKAVIAGLPNAHGVIVGHPVASEPTVWGEVEREINECALGGRVHMVGFRADAQTMVGEFSVFLLTSSAEGTPNVLLEAMAHGVPIVAPAIDGIPALIEDGNTGFLYSPKDESAAAEAVARLLEDEALARKTSEAARAWVRGFHACNVMADSFQSAYTRALEEHRPWETP